MKKKKKSSRKLGKDPSKFIDKTIIKWKMYFCIKKPVLWTTDFKIWKQLGGRKIGYSEKSVFGSIHIPQNIIFINLKNNDTKEEMETTILHELLHSKYPRLSDRKLEKKVHKILHPQTKKSNKLGGNLSCTC